MLISLTWLYRGPVGASGRGHQADPLGSSAWLVLKGTASVTHDGRTHAARAGEWLFPKPVPRHQDFSPDARILSLRFQAEWPDGRQLFDEGLSAVLNGRSHPELRKAAEGLEATLRRFCGDAPRRESFARLRVGLADYLGIERRLLAWAAAWHAALAATGLSPEGNRLDDPRLRRALDLLNQWPLHQPLPDALLTRQAGVGRSQLDRLFLREVGMTPRQYLDRRRLRQASRRLGHHDRQVKEVAYEVGFRHVSSFSAWIRKRTGLSPTRLRERSPV